MTQGRSTLPPTAGGMGGDGGALGPMADAADVRVILVGRTGLDAMLRLDPGVELVRVRSDLEAIAELADPIDGMSPESATVVVSGSMLGSAASARELVEALRQVHPPVRVLVAEPADAPAVGGWEALRPSFDGLVPLGLSSAQVRALVRGSTPAPALAETGIPPGTNAGSPAHRGDENDEPPESSRALVEQIIGPAAGAGAGVGSAGGMTSASASAPGYGHVAQEADLVLIQALLTGRDVLESALAVVRGRLGAPGARFVSRESCGEEGPGLSPEAWTAEVSHRGRVLGWLVAAHRDGQEVAREARWLAHWLALREQHEQLRRAALTDDLTGAWNRRYFWRYLAGAIRRAHRDRQTVTVLLFDIDDFKKYNDRYGHEAGDEILTESVRLLKSVIRPTDRVCRIGGDEFAVIFYEPAGPRDPGSRPPRSVRDIARRFQQQICDHRFPKLGEEAAGTLTISGGLATYPWDGRNPEELLARADELALRSKRLGKNAIRLGPDAQRVCGILESDGSDLGADEGGAWDEPAPDESADDPVL